VSGASENTIEGRMALALFDCFRKHWKSTDRERLDLLHAAVDVCRDVQSAARAEGWKAGMERAAKVCDKLAEQHCRVSLWIATADRDCAAAIRAASQEKQP